MASALPCVHDPRSAPNWKWQRAAERLADRAEGFPEGVGSRSQWSGRRSVLRPASWEARLSENPEEAGISTFQKGGPSELRQLEQEIQRSRRILSLEDDWDGEGSKGYSEQAWSRATGYLRRQARACWLRHGVVIPTPTIGPGPEGSIDIHWQTEFYELLVNIPADPAIPASFYGDDYGTLSIKGTFDPSAEPSGHLALVSWLVRD
jgi:hypothetical protein